jgi:hypothetical protein
MFGRRKVAMVMQKLNSKYRLLLRLGSYSNLAELMEATAVVQIEIQQSEANERTPIQYNCVEPDWAYKPATKQRYGAGRLFSRWERMRSHTAAQSWHTSSPSSDDSYLSDQSSHFVDVEYAHGESHGKARHVYRSPEP